MVNLKVACILSYRKILTTCEKEYNNCMAIIMLVLSTLLHIYSIGRPFEVFGWV